MNGRQRYALLGWSFCSFEGMRGYNWGAKSLALKLLAGAHVVCAQTFQHVEPPNWWTGLESDTVVVMFHGKNVGTWTVGMAEAEVDLIRTERVSSPNYLFVCLRPNASSLSTDTLWAPLEFRNERGQVVAKWDYPFVPRSRPAAAFEGYNPSDVLCLITPDRFANGNLENDNIAGMGDGVNREDDHGRHGGDIAGIRAHLGHLQEMGYTAIWLNPVVENRMPESSYHGYAATDFYAVDARFGGNEAYLGLAEELRERGMKLVMDMIINHCGLGHWWMRDLPDEDWVHQHDPFQQTNHRRTTLRDPHATQSDRVGFSNGWFVPTMPDLNQNHHLLGNYLIQNTIWWVETLGLGGIRMDTYPYSDPEFLTRWSCAVMKEYPNFSICGEEWSLNPAVLAYWQRGALNRDGYESCLPGLLDFPLQKACVDALTRQSEWESNWLCVYETLSNDFLYAEPSAHVIFPDNHDMSRIATQLGDDPDLVKLALTFFATTRGTPTFYYGTEIFMSNTGDNSHGNIRSEFPGGWKDASINGFTGQGLSDDALGVQDHMKRLLSWRQNASAVHHGELIHFAPQDKENLYVYVRRYAEELVWIALNSAAHSLDVPASRYAEVLPEDIDGWDVLADKQVHWQVKGRLEIPPKSALVWSFKFP